MKLLQNGVLYDLVQWLAGGDRSRVRLHRELLQLPSRSVVIDVGGGTGVMRRFTPAHARYVCVDIEEPKLRRCLAARSDAAAVLGDATMLPARDGCADAVIAMAVSHHLTDEQLRNVLDEIQRVLKTSGKLLFLDAVRTTALRGRFMWGLDRGANPREADALIAVLAERFRVSHLERYSWLHDYLYVVADRA